MRYQIYNNTTNRVVFETGDREELDAEWRDMCRKFREKYPSSKGMMLSDYYGCRQLRDKK